MSYISRDMAKEAVSKMRHFHDDIVGLYQNHNMNLLDNLGRRNIVMSQSQEKFFAQVLGNKYNNVCNDGQTGKPDIIIGELDKELECKLTSRHKGGGISFQTDYATLSQKGELDYLYVVADQNFEKFAVLHFEGLTTDDFRKVSNGSRGKVGMKKHFGMKKCNVLVGDVINLNTVNINKLSEKLNKPGLTASQKKKIRKSLQYWTLNPARYQFDLEEVSFA